MPLMHERYSDSFQNDSVVWPRQAKGCVNMVRT